MLREKLGHHTVHIFTVKFMGSHIQVFRSAVTGVQRVLHALIDFQHRLSCISKPQDLLDLQYMTNMTNMTHNDMHHVHVLTWESSN